uniref:Uncharacterized protein n=1 Tax=Hyaloperonospora arabidopsidis (strain Emoy2) TaxID=559515 RepID=M4BNR1_HYAAE
MVRVVVYGSLDPGSSSDPSSLTFWTADAVLWRRKAFSYDTSPCVPATRPVPHQRHTICKWGL